MVSIGNDSSFFKWKLGEIWWGWGNKWGEDLELWSWDG